MEELQSHPKRENLDGETKYRLLWQALKNLEQQLVQSIRLADPKLGALEHLAKLVRDQAALSLISEVNLIIEDLENGLDPSRDRNQMED